MARFRYRKHGGTPGTSVDYTILSVVEYLGFMTFVFALWITMKHPIGYVLLNFMGMNAIDQIFYNLLFDSCFLILAVITTILVFAKAGKG